MPIICTGCAAWMDVMFPETSLTEATSCTKRIPLENWRTAAARITIKTSQANSQNVEQCYCKWHQAAEEALDLTQKLTDEVEASKVCYMEPVRSAEDAGGSSTCQANKTQQECSPPSKWRKNTLEEKRRYQKRRKNKRRKERVTKKSQTQPAERDDSELREAKYAVKTYKGMAHTYWDRWQWELQKQKDSMPEVLSRSLGSEKIHDIDITDPTIDGKPTEVYNNRKRLFLSGSATILSWHEGCG